MALSYDDAYQQIKALEAGGVSLPLPAPTDAILVGSIDARSGTFAWLVPTFQQTYEHVLPSVAAAPPLKNVGSGGLSGDGDGSVGAKQGSGGTTDPPTTITVGIVATNCVNLTLMFEVTNVPLQTEQQTPQAATVVSTTGGEGISGASGSTGNVTIDGFPTSGTQGSRIYLSAGLATSSMEQTQMVIPAVSVFPIGITVNGTLQYVHIAILRPPVLGLGAFTIPALPAAIVFAPPQGTLAKNSNTFNDKVTYTRSMSVQFGSQTTTKTAQAYTSADLAGKVASLTSQLASLIAGLGAIGAAGGSNPSLINVISGPPGGGTLTGVESAGGGGGGISFGDALKDYDSAWSIVNNILTGLGPQGSTSDSSSITTQTNQTMTLAITLSDIYGSAAGLGPLAGDRFVYLTNVRAIWANLNGEVAITVLGYDGVDAFPGQTLLADLQALASGGTAESNLDAASIQLLLALDPYYLAANGGASSSGTPLVAPPRFTPMDPLNRAGAGTAATGDVFSRANESITDTSTTSTSQTVNVTDVKPGWIDVLTGTANTETTTTSTVTNTVTSDQKTDETITNTVTMVSAGSNDPYAICMYYDNLFQTLVPVPANSAVLQGTAAATPAGATAATAAVH